MVALRGKEGRLRHRFDLAGAGGLGTDAEGVERRDSCAHILSKHSGARDRRAFRTPRRAVRTICSHHVRRCVLHAARRCHIVRLWQLRR